MLQEIVQNAILMPHDVDSLSVSRNVAKRSEPRRINVMHLVYKNPTGQPWIKSGHDGIIFEPSP
jgi:hypothetical protein